jgi:hypothetical protein
MSNIGNTRTVIFVTSGTYFLIKWEVCSIDSKLITEGPKRWHIICFENEATSSARNDWVSGLIANDKAVLLFVGPWKFFILVLQKNG